VEIEEKSRTIPVWAQVDVLVAGGGTAGVAAAIASARLGTKTLLVESTSQLGGSQTGALVTPMMANHINGAPLNRGLNEELQNRYAQFESISASEPLGKLWHNPTSLVFVLEDAVLEAGADILYNTLCADVLKEGATVVGAVMENKSGRGAVLSRVVIDCTGDADLAAKAGVPFQKGNEEGICQPMSLRFTMANVDLEEAAAFFKSLGIHASPPLMSVGFHEAHESPISNLVESAEAEGVLEPEDLGYFQFFTMAGRPNEVNFNCPRLSGFDPTNAWEVSRALTTGRRKIRRIAEFCKKYLPGFQKAYVSTVAPMLGVRESRRIIGEYVLTEDDIMEARKFPDAIARNCYPIDIHNPHGRGTTIRRLPPGEYNEVPYRCLVPLQIDGLLVAGRCISATFAAQAAVRVQDNCRAFGQAAGAAAALAAQLGIQPRHIEFETLRKALAESLQQDSK